MKKLIETAKKAFANPYRKYFTVVDGFDFGVYWDTNRSTFICSIYYTPSWPHCHYVYGDTVEQFIENAKAQIAEDKKIYKNGGNFPEDYHDNPPYLR